MPTKPRFDKIRAIKTAFNIRIARAATPEARLVIFELASSVLMEAKSYGGFGYTDWMNGGYTRWVDAGQPDDNTPFLGDQTKRELY